MSPGRQTLLVAIVVAICIVVDQSAKHAAGALDSLPPLYYLGGVVRFYYVENPGAFMSLGAALPETARFWLFTVVAGAALLGLIAYACMCAGLRPMAVVALAMVAGGGISNVIDRTYNSGAVIDFVGLGVGTLRTGIFNLADAAITVGMLLLILSAFRRHAG
ncbi:MAG: signal peptidase II [Gammaproteobacteria bacterium]